MTSKDKKNTTPSITSPHKKRSSQRIYLYISLVFVLLISVYEMIFAHQLNEQLVTLHQTFLHLENEHEHEFKMLTQSLHTQAAQNKQIQEEMRAFEQKIQESIQEKNNLTDNWRILQARYCLELAYINTIAVYNPEIIMAFLQQARQFLSTSSDPDLSAIQQALTQTIDQIKKEPRLDPNTLLVALESAQESIMQLPLPLPAATLTPSIMPLKKNKFDLLPTLQASLHDLKSLFIIRHTNEKIQPLHTQAYLNMVQEEIRLKLQTAQWSILNNQHNVYVMSLSAAMQKIQNTFDVHAPSTRTLLQQLNTLQHRSWPHNTQMIAPLLKRLNLYMTNTAVEHTS